VIRGGSWFDGAEGIRATARGEDAIGSRYSTRGFRLARTN
jgi:formylglycine-generating enzyme required for sulfatase activity